MNHQRKSDMDPLQVPESPETSERLDELERRLKATRPQPPRLDVAALQRLAVDVSADRAVDRRPVPVVRGRKRPIGGRLLVAASSWICGAGVGALVMFVLMSRTVPIPEPNKEVVSIERKAQRLVADDSSSELPVERESDPLDGSPATKKVTARESRAPRLTMDRTRLWQAESTYLSREPTLHVGMYLGRNVTPSVWAFERTVEKERERMRDDEREPPRPWTKSTLDPQSSPPVSRKALMEEFLGETSAAIL